MNLLTVLNSSFGLSLEQIEQGLVLRANKVYADTYYIEDWLKDEKLIPDWASRAAASWLIEMWLSERDACNSSELLKVDEKYTRLLRDFSLSDIIAMRSELSRPSGIGQQ
ncbi:MAG: hypothetical protein AMJ55_06460 [Gammaproteobacteria bacterium SG8_15]|jgi:hypothetical protein|nr:MAG: hypothetical protein AMJ55_06460 [Gammaproteobacteria bacterium SG8_15]